MTIKKLDPTSESERNLVTDYWLNIEPGQVVDGMPVADVIHFK
jgi:hypothetical protein